MKKSITLLAVLGLVLALAPAAHAQTIITLVGTNSTAVDEQGAGRDATNVTNGSGMTGEGATGLHTADDPNEGWEGADNNMPKWFRVDLGATYAVGTMYVWNGESTVHDRGAETVDIYYSTVASADASNFGSGDWTLWNGGGTTFALKADNQLDYLPTDAFELNVTARIIAFNITAFWTQGPVSINELQFFTAPSDPTGTVFWFR